MLDPTYRAAEPFFANKNMDPAQIAVMEQVAQHLLLHALAVHATGAAEHASFALKAAAEVSVAINECQGIGQPVA